MIIGKKEKSNKTGKSIDKVNWTGNRRKAAIAVILIKEALSIKTSHECRRRQEQDNSVHAERH